MGRRWVRIAVFAFVLLGVGFLTLVTIREWERLEALRRDVVDAPWDVRASWLAASVAVATGNLLLMSGVWVRLYRRSGGGVSYVHGWRIWSATNMGRYIPGKLWHLAGLTAYLRNRGEPGAAGLVSAVAFQVLILVTGSAAAAAVVLGRPDVLPGGSALRIGAAVAFLALALHPRVLEKATELAARLTREHPERTTTRIPGTALIRGGALLLLSWLVSGASFWMALRGLLPEPGYGLLDATGVYAASYVAGYLAFVSPGGLLVREGAMVALLLALGGMGAAVAGVVAVAYRLCVTLAELLFLGLTFALPPLLPADSRPDASHTPSRPPSEPPGEEAPSDSPPGQGVEES